jgi:hypothetical protein
LLGLKIAGKSQVWGYTSVVQAFRMLREEYGFTPGYTTQQDLFSKQIKDNKQNKNTQQKPHTHTHTHTQSREM